MAPKVFWKKTPQRSFLKVTDKPRKGSSKKDKLLVVGLGEVLKEECRTSNLCK